ncbi:MAG: restriction endonuclease subunit S [Bacteroidales bacterium]|nr:restriction endonuclease subunit S [Bacteroidales bacterium]
MMREDWIETYLINVCDVLDNLRKPINSGERKRRVEGKAENELFPYYGATGQVGYIDDYLTDGDYILIGEDGAPFLNNKNVAYKISGKAWVNNHAHILKPFFINGYLLHYLNQFQYRDYVTGTTRLKLTQGALKKIPIKISPISEQRAIVTKIENLFASLDKGIDDLKKAQEQLKIYRQAVLKKAFEGKWDKSNIGALFDFVGGGTPSKKEKKYWNGNIPWASVKDIKGNLLKDTIDNISEQGLNNSASNLAHKGEIILVTRISPGQSIITDIDTAINQDLKIVQPKSKMSNKFIHYLFRSIERECVRLSSGTTVLGINLVNLKSIEIPFIKFEEQQQIVKEIESRLSVCDKVEQSIQEGLEKAEALRQSILKKAFNGELLSEAEIEKCKQEADYEPASVLLERIKEEKNK